MLFKPKKKLPPVTNKPGLVAITDKLREQLDHLDGAEQELAQSIRMTESLRDESVQRLEGLNYQLQEVRELRTSLSGVISKVAA